jgi:hypothetical protein
MKFRLEIDTGNAAFSDGNLGNEIARILKKVAAKVCDDTRALHGDSKLHDYNGNTVGTYGYESD